MTATCVPFTDVYSAALRGEACRVAGVAGDARPLPVEVWTRPADPSDAAVLEYCEGPTLDVGCGPGRMTEHLAGRGHLALGVDLVPEAVSRTRARGASALRRDVFGPLPGEGRWGTALLADGNLGIGGDPVALLTRIAVLLAPGGRVVADLSPPGVALERRLLWLETRSARSWPFPWAEVGVDGIPLLAAATGFGPPQVHHVGARWFAVLHRAV